jgi:hypothetical protein
MSTTLGGQLWNEQCRKGKKEEKKEKNNDKGESQRKWKLAKDKNALQILLDQQKRTPPQRNRGCLPPPSVPFCQESFVSQP